MVGMEGSRPMLRQDKPRLETPKTNHEWVHVSQKQPLVPALTNVPEVNAVQAKPAVQQSVQNKPAVQKQPVPISPAEIEALRAAYQTVLVSDALSNLRVSQTQPSVPTPAPSSFLQVLKKGNRQKASKPANKPILSEIKQITMPTADMTLEDLELDSLADESFEAVKEPWGSRFFKQPTWFVSLSIGLCVAASAAYAGLGYWVLMSGSPSQAAETVNVVNMKEDTIKENALNGLENLQKLQEQSQGGIVVPQETSEPEALNLLAVAAKSPLDNIVPGVSDMQKEMVGRPDPFAPLIQEGVQNTDPLLAQPKDILDDVMFTGFIGDVNSKDKVAIIQIASGGTPQTLVKKVGETIVIEGEQLILKSISKEAVVLNVNGRPRRLALSPYADTVANTGNPSAAPGNGNGPADTTTAKTGTGADKTSPANPGLIEPGADN